MNQKGFVNIILITAIIVLVLVAGGVVYYINKQKNPTPAGQQQPQNETANWKTYRNEKYEFEIKFSQDWIISTNSDQETMKWYHNFRWLNGGMSDGYFSVEVGSNPRSMAYLELQDVNFLNCTAHYKDYNNEDIIMTFKKISIGGDYACKNSGKGAGEKIYLLHKSIPILISYENMSLKNEFEGFSSDIREILSTFKFLK